MFPRKTNRKRGPHFNQGMGSRNIAKDDPNYVYYLLAKLSCHRFVEWQAARSTCSTFRPNLGHWLQADVSSHELSGVTFLHPFSPQQGGMRSPFSRKESQVTRATRAVRAKKGTWARRMPAWTWTCRRPEHAGRIGSHASCPASRPHVKHEVQAVQRG